MDDWRPRFARLLARYYIGEIGEGAWVEAVKPEHFNIIAALLHLAYLVTRKEEVLDTAIMAYTAS